MLTIGEKRSRGKFYRGPTVGAKCTYQNLGRIDARVDVAKMGSLISHVGLQIPFTRRKRWGTCKTKDFDAQVICVGGSLTSVLCCNYFNHFLL